MRRIASSDRLGILTARDGGNEVAAPKGCTTRTRITRCSDPKLVHYAIKGSGAKNLTQPELNFSEKFIFHKEASSNLFLKFKIAHDLIKFY
jgi:hypothetical protein